MPRSPATTAKPGGAPQPRVSRRARRIIRFALLALAVVWVLVAARAVLSAKRDAQAGLDVLQSAKRTLDPDDLLRGKGRGALIQAQTHFARAHSSVTGPLIAPLRVVPWVGRQVRSVDAMTASAGQVVGIGMDALDDARRAVDAVEHPNGRQRVRLVAELGAIAQRASSQLEPLGLGPTRGLAGPLRTAHDRFARELDDVRANTRDLATASVGLARFLDGPSRYLVMAANNAEMRAGSGAFLSLGEMTLSHGKFKLGEMRPAVSLMPGSGAVAATAAGDRDIAARWSALDPTADFRELAVTGRFDAVGPLAVKMWKSATGHDVDGVMVLDPVALQALLSAAGPVRIPGDPVVYTKQNLLQQVFVEQYRGLTLDPLHYTQSARREKLSKIARAAIQNLDTGKWDTIELAEQLRRAAAGRHLLAWSDVAAEQAGWKGAHIDGHLPADSLLLSVHNRGGNKLDQFLPVDAVVDTAVAPDGTSNVQLQLDVANVTPLPLQALPNYVIGPYPGTPDGAAGKYVGFVVAELPRDAFDSFMEVDGKRVGLASVGSNGPDHRVVATYVALEAGQKATVVVKFRLPKGERTIELRASSRVLNPSVGRAAIRWKFDGPTFGDEQSHRISW